MAINGYKRAGPVRVRAGPVQKEICAVTRLVRACRAGSGSRLLYSCSARFSVAVRAGSTHSVTVAIRACQKTGPVPCGPSRPARVATSTWSPVKLGFGYDFVSDDYKFVRILVSSVSYVVEAELYSVNEDCSKDIELPKEVQRVWPFMNLIRVHAIDGVLYLIGLDVLVLFHLHNEVFDVHPYLDSVKGKVKFTIFDFGGCVAMIFKMVVGDGSVYSFWTLDDVCGKVGWTKKFDLEPDLQMDRVDLYLGDGQFVTQEYHIGFFVYDLMKKETTRLHFPVDDRMIISPVKYTDSLVSLNGFEQVNCSLTIVSTDVSSQ